MVKYELRALEEKYLPWHAVSMPHVFPLLQQQTSGSDQNSNDSYPRQGCIQLLCWWALISLWEDCPLLLKSVTDKLQSEPSFKTAQKMPFQIWGTMPVCLVWRLQLPWSIATHTSPEKARLEVLIILSLRISLYVYVIFTDNSTFGKYNTEIEKKTGLLNSSRALHTKYPYQKYLWPKIVSLSLTYSI